MPKHSETRFLPYTPQQLYELVLDIERYPEFLPWCLAARILSNDEREVKAELIAGYKALREKFTSVVHLTPGKKLEVEYVSGPLQQLRNVWRFDAARGGCQLGFELEFTFKSSLLAGLFEMFFEQALRRMAGAFEARAHALYGRR